MSNVSPTRPGLILPDPWECPQLVAEAIWDIRNRQDGAHTHKFLRDKYGTEDFYMLAVEAVFESNSWTLTANDKKVFRKAYREVPVTGVVWMGNAKKEQRERLQQPKKWSERPSEARIVDDKK